MNKKVLGVLLASVVAMGSMGVSVYAADAEEDRNYSEYTPAKTSTISYSSRRLFIPGTKA